MSKYLLPIILIGLTFGLFYLVIDPQYQEAQVLRVEQQSYDQALTNSLKIQGLRDKLMNSYNTFSPADVTRLERLLPDTVDNVRLVLDINNIAGRYGLIIKNVRLANLTKDPNQLGPENKEYGTLVLQFSVNASYANFTAFMRDLEDSLRVVDISSISFKTGDTQQVDYDVSVQTYWLK